MICPLELTCPDIMTVDTCQNISVIIINYLLPCLTFNKVISSISSSDLRTIGVLLLTAVIYQVVGLSFGIFTRALTPNPKYWAGGLIAAGAFTNAGDLPIAYITTLSTGTLFSSSESSKGIAYCVIFLGLFIFSMFNLGGYKLVQKDFARKTHDIEEGKYDPNRKNEPGLLALIRDIQTWYKSRKDPPIKEEKRIPIVPYASAPIPIEKTMTNNELRRCRSSVAQATVPGLGTLSTETLPLRKVQSEDITDVINAYQSSRLRKTTSRQLAVHRETQEDENSASPESSNDSKSQPKESFLDKHHVRFLWDFIKNFRKPPSVALISSIVITMIPKVRRLFYNDPAQHVTGIRNAPDGAPALGFVMDFTTFVGNAAVPLGLAMLGATMARLSVKKLPNGFWQSVLLMSVFKLVVLPIIAVAWTCKMRDIKWIDPSNHMAIFVMIISSGVPSATSQVYLTAIFMTPESDGKEEMDCLATYLICQYVLLIFSMTILLTYTLKDVLSL